MRKSPLAAIVRRVASGRDEVRGAPGAGRPAAISATAATSRSTGGGYRVIRSHQYTSCHSMTPWPSSSASPPGSSPVKVPNGCR
jgi:hypothetical protein